MLMGETEYCQFGNWFIQICQPVRFWSVPLWKVPSIETTVAMFSVPIMQLFRDGTRSDRDEELLPPSTQDQSLLQNNHHHRKNNSSLTISIIHFCDVTVMWVLPYFIIMLANRADVNWNVYKYINIYIYKVLML